MLDSATEYGNGSWQIIFTDKILQPIMLCADMIEVTPSGDLIAWGGFREEGEDSAKEKIPVYCVSKGNWLAFWPESYLDGHPIAVRSN